MSYIAGIGDLAPAQAPATTSTAVAGCPAGKMPGYSWITPDVGPGHWARTPAGAADTCAPGTATTNATVRDHTAAATGAGAGATSPYMMYLAIGGAVLAAYLLLRHPKKAVAPAPAIAAPKSTTKSISSKAAP